MHFPSSYLAYQVLVLPAGFVLFYVARQWTRRLIQDDERAAARTLCEVAIMLAIALPWMFIGYSLMHVLGSSTLFFPVGTLFWAGALFGGLAWLVRGITRRRAIPALFGLFVPALAITMVFIEADRLTITHLPQFKWSSTRPSTRPIRVAHLTDLQTVGFAEREERALAAVHAYDPDLIALTGDFATGGYDAEVHARRFLERLPRRAKVFAVRGDAEDPKELAWLFDGLDIVLLNNEGRVVELCGGALYVCGIERMGPDPARALREAPEGLPRLVLSHAADPLWVLEDQELEAQLLLAGHTHGGQVCIPGFGAPLTLSVLPRKFASGFHELEGTVEAVSIGRGIGMEGKYAPRMRLFCPPEITFFAVSLEPPSIQ